MLRFTASRLLKFNAPFTTAAFSSCRASSFVGNRYYSSDAVVDEADVVIVGGGPSGLSSAIHLKNLADKGGKELRIVLVEKASEVG